METMKNKYVAAAMAFLLGSFGAHKFYLREAGSGIFYVMLFMMTQEFFPVSAILGLIDGMRYLTMGQEEFDRKFNGGRRGQLPPPIGRRKKRRGNRDYYEYPKRKQRIPKRRKRATVLRSNPFKKSGVKKYKEFDIEEAIVDFEKGLKIQPNDESLHFHLACAYSLLENKEKAFHHIAKAVETGLTDYKKIQNHDDLAYMRIQPEYEKFKSNGFKELIEKPNSKKKQESADADEFLLEKLGKLVEMRKRGIVTEADFRIEREKILRKA